VVCPYYLPRPIGYAWNPVVYYLLAMAIMHMTVEVASILDEMFPNTALP
jgi:hypothetical protein